MPSLGLRGVDIFAALGNSAPGIGEWSEDCLEEDGRAGLLALLVFWRNLVRQEPFIGIGTQAKETERFEKPIGMEGMQTIIFFTN